MGWDSSQTDDTVIDINGVNFVINTDLFDRIKPINLDYGTQGKYTGFILESPNLKKPNCGGCKC